MTIDYKSYADHLAQRKPFNPAVVKVIMMLKRIHAFDGKTGEEQCAILRAALADVKCAIVAGELGRK